MTELASITARGLLEAWERALFAPPVARPLVLLEEVTGADRSALAELPLGARDRLLLGLRRAALGSRIECEARCPACGERVELDVSAPALEFGSPSVESTSFEIEQGDWRIAFRLPTTADLFGYAGADSEAARRIVLRCVTEVYEGDIAVEAHALPDAALEAVAQRCTELDPQADIELDIACPACGHRWRSPFEIAAFLWSELESWARRMLDDIHVIASRYGWSETAILDLSPSRRRYYLERLTS